jgi:hypothetical protein
MRRTFVESSAFTESLKKLNEGDFLFRIQKMILEDVEVGVLVSGSGGVRKFRIARSGGGKSGGYRVFYLDLPKLKMTHLLLLLSKNEKENISGAEKNEMKVETKKLKGRKQNGK